ncbi:hypothetical protein [Halodurantibacterium flavum]
MANHYDAIDIIDILRGAAFQGRFLAAAPAIPRPAFVEQELRAAAESFSVEVLVPERP